ncbi:MAG: hypothetical protein KIS79_12940 [Burkholderiales bacterium]|nr:hypothetical protein [Burkholderiales bacterium]
MSISHLKIAVALVACTGLSACAFWKQPEVPQGAGSGVALYNSNQLTPAQYQVVEHIWIDDWHSNVRIPTFASVDEGIAALKDRAGAAGATGLIHAMCLDGTGYAAGRLLCYGDAIHLN